MREYSTPLTATIAGLDDSGDAAGGNLTDAVVRNATDHPDTVVFSRRAGSGWSDVTAAEFLDQVRAVAKGLVASGIEAGDRVALLSRTRYEWTLLDYAI
ncbi:MAG: Long-chain-fatty-acid--CoA ligase FadD15, partial [Nocardioidaceae bacterium]|nr:Long-chain-fatty-acid--CoA ligase FadD15 [Nocardioidaceae bacterium]